MPVAQVIKLGTYPTSIPHGNLRFESSQIEEHQFKNIKLILISNPQDHRFTALFINHESLLYFPTETHFSTSSLESLKSQIEIEARTATFSNFLGVTNKKRVLAFIQSL